MAARRMPHKQARIAVEKHSPYNRASLAQRARLARRAASDSPPSPEEDPMTGRSLIRVLRWAALAAVAPALWACTARSLEKPMLTPESTFGKTFQQTVNRNLDLLFMVDNSSSMRLSQT